MWYLALIFLIWSGSSVSKLTDPKCPLFTYKSHFNMSLFAGSWYQQAKFGSLLFGGLETCGLLECQYNPDYDELYISYSSTSVLDQTHTKYNGEGLYRYTNKKDGVLAVTWEYDPEYKQEAVTKLFIVETNYDDFAVLASCSNNVLSGWVVTRVQHWEENADTLLPMIVDAMRNVNDLEAGLQFDSQLGCNHPLQNVDDHSCLEC